MSATRTLFVYGTLRPAARCDGGRPLRARLATHTLRAMPASAIGRLLDLGEYPGFVELESGTCSITAGTQPSRVHGDLVELDAPERVWPWLDSYEGCDPAAPAASLYHRVIRPVTLVDGATIEAWLYVLARPPARPHLIRSGDWLDR